MWAKTVTNSLPDRCGPKLLPTASQKYGLKLLPTAYRFDQLNIEYLNTLFQICSDFSPHWLILSPLNPQDKVNEMREMVAPFPLNTQKCSHALLDASHTGSHVCALVPKHITMCCTCIQSGPIRIACIPQAQRYPNKLQRAAIALHTRYRLDGSSRLQGNTLVLSPP